MRDMDPDYAAYVAARQQHLLRSATLLCGDVHQAQDLLQEAMIKLALKWETVKHGYPDAYVRRILYRDSVSWWRKRRRERLRDSVPEQPGPDDADSWLSSWQVRDALLTLPQRQRAVLVLRYYDDLTEAQSAEALGTSVGTVKSQAHKALKALREELQTDVTDRQTDVSDRQADRAGSPRMEGQER